MLEGLILGVFLMTAEQAATPAAPVDTTSAAAAADTTAPTEEAAPADPAPAEAAPPADATPAPAPAATNDANRVRCHRGPPEVGSIMGRRICSTRTQDRERARQDAEQLQRMQREQTGTGNLSGAGGG